MFLYPFVGKTKSRMIWYTCCKYPFLCPAHERRHRIRSHENWNPQPFIVLSISAFLLTLGGKADFYAFHTWQWWLAAQRWLVGLVENDDDETWLVHSLFSRVMLEVWPVPRESHNLTLSYNKCAMFAHTLVYTCVFVASNLLRWHSCHSSPVRLRLIWLTLWQPRSGHATCDKSYIIPGHSFLLASLCTKMILLLKSWSKKMSWKRCIMYSLLILVLSAGLRILFQITTLILRRYAHLWLCPSRYSGGRLAAPSQSHSGERKKYASH